MQQVENKVLEQLHWRYATKKFSDRKLTEEQLDVLLEAVRLAPTSYGQQPFRVVRVENQALREKLVPASFGQDKVANASHLLVFAVQTDLSEKTVADYISRTAEVWDMQRSELEGFEGVVNNLYAGMSAEAKEHWAARQAYIGLSFLMQTAALEEIDVCPMEGINPEQYDEILDLAAHNLKTVVVATVGFRAEDDSAQHLAKSRKSKEQMFLTI